MLLRTGDIMSNELINFLRPFGLIVIENFGKLKGADFLSALEKAYIKQGLDATWFDENRSYLVLLIDKLITNAISDWLEVQYQNYPHATERAGTKVIAGKVENLNETSASSMYSYSEKNGWGLWRSTGMEGGKKLQTIYLHGETEPYYVIWGSESIGIRKFNIIDFEWEQKSTFRVIVKRTLEGHGDGFGGSKPITVHKIHYPSIRSAHSRIKPAIGYSAICSRIRSGLTPEEAFDKPNMRTNSSINKLGVVVHKEQWGNPHRKI